MAVFPESMNMLDTEDTKRSLTIIDSYIRYMAERIEFAMSNMTRTVSEAGVSSVEMYILLTAVQQQVATLQSNVSTLQGDVTNIGRSIAAIEARLGTFADTDPTISATLADHESRIQALEQ